MEDIIKQCKVTEDAKTSLEHDLKLKQEKLNQVSSQYEMAEENLKQMREKYEDSSAG